MLNSNSTKPRPNLGLLIITWIVALVILLTIAYKWMFTKQVMRTVDCLDEAASAQSATSALSAVNKYAACIAWVSGGAKTATVDARPARCRFAGVWTSARGNVTYEVTLEADGKFTGEPGQNTSANEQTVTGAWAVAGNSLVWAYDSGAVWPPDINPISAQSDKGFTLTEVNGSTTRYTLIERSTAKDCEKK